MKTDSISVPASVLTSSQVKKYRYESKPTDKGHPFVIVASVRHDDECRNGHNTFAITGEIFETHIQRGEKTARHESAGKTLWLNSCGCVHDAISQHFPSLAPFIKWHLMGTDAPRHYVANTIYLAGNRDHWGKLKGEPMQWQRVLKWKGFPIWYWGRSHTSGKFLAWCEEQGSKHVADCEVIALWHDTEKDRETFGPKYTLGGYPHAEKWHECPFDSELEALQFLAACKSHGYVIAKEPSAWGEGKERELDKARAAAIWPEATDAELSVEPDQLKAVLLARLPALMEQFKKDVESLGFVY